MTPDARLRSNHREGITRYVAESQQGNPMRLVLMPVDRAHESFVVELSERGPAVLCEDEPPEIPAVRPRS